MIIRLFVYGTLVPGHEAWPVLEPWVVGEPLADAVAGRLYDTGRGYPAATFGPDAAAAHEVVHGVVVTLDPDRATAALAALDRYEGHEYARRIVETASGIQAATYAWIAGTDGCRPVPSGRWVDGPQTETPPPTGR